MSLSEHQVAAPAELAACVDHLAKQSAIGFDTEFVSEDSYRTELCLIQVASDERLFVIDPFACGSLDDFWQLLLDPNRVVVVHAGREEIRLCRDHAGQPPTRLFDLQLAAGLLGHTYPIGHGPLIEQTLGVRLTKGETLTDWRMRPLTPRQFRYAFDDVRYLLPLWRKLSSGLDSLGRLDWAEEENQTLVRRSVIDNPAVEKWRKLRGVGALDRRKLAIVRELFVWRDQFASATNRPTRFIIRDDLLVEIARRNPRVPADLEALRGLPKQDLTPILEAVERARQLPPEVLPEQTERDFDPPQVGLASSLLMASLADFCHRERLAVSQTATASEVKALIRSRLEDAPLPDLAVTRGWRGRHVLPHLLAVLEGRRSLRLGDLRRPAPFDYVDG
jgi:ribonuclease D